MLCLQGGAGGPRMHLSARLSALQVPASPAACVWSPPLPPQAWHARCGPPAGPGSRKTRAGGRAALPLPTAKASTSAPRPNGRGSACGSAGCAHLPEELQGAHKGAGAHLPAVHVGPLVDEQRQVAVALHPLQRGWQQGGGGGRRTRVRAADAADAGLGPPWATGLAHSGHDCSPC